VSRGRSLVGKLLALVCMGALLVPSILTAKTTKRSRAAKRDATVSGGKTADRPSRAAKSTSKSTRSATSRTASSSFSRSKRANRKATARKGTRSYRRFAHASHRRTRLARTGDRGTVDEHIHVRKGDTLETILAARGVGITEAREWIASTVDVFDLTKIRPRQGLTLSFDRETHGIAAIRYEVDQRKLLVASQGAEGITAHMEDLPYFVEVKGIAGSIARGLREYLGAGDAR